MGWFSKQVTRKNGRRRRQAEVKRNGRPEKAISGVQKLFFFRVRKGNKRNTTPFQGLSVAFPERRDAGIVEMQTECFFKESVSSYNTG